MEKGAVPPTGTHSDPATEALLPIPVTVSCWPSTLSARGKSASQEHDSIEWKLGPCPATLQSSRLCIKGKEGGSGAGWVTAPSHQEGTRLLIHSGGAEECVRTQEIL